jgi:hypothetical protein
VVPDERQHAHTVGVDEVYTTDEEGEEAGEQRNDEENADENQVRAETPHLRLAALTALRGDRVRGVLLEKGAVRE